ncbi:OLC1v1029652C1 [Oldenlandia corymbosa var. corymbosa]|uniref:OLC1v1029652C1 n=1 Tax=Oldenlandia corymbosa var. corymbosa TaxID=529605 RepID=A0AAV1CHA8_OLDCO|nr:OLC1v1029652C1 [Oldenlandia corymbosa var. corymbosa]
MVGSGLRRLDEIFDQTSLDWKNVIDESNVPFENFDSNGYNHFKDDTPSSPPLVRHPPVVRRLTVHHGGMPVEDLVASKAYQGGEIQGKEVLQYCRIGRYARDQAIAWLWLMLGNTLLTDRSGTRIRVVILSEIVDDLATCHELSWGSATLAYLYRQLDVPGGDRASGDLTMPQAGWWDVPGRDNIAKRLKKFRREINGLTATDVTWLPYGLEPVDDDPSTLYNGWIQYRDIIEPYLLVRVLRQIEYIQTISPPIPSPSEVFRSNKSKMYKII